MPAVVRGAMLLAIIGAILLIASSSPTIAGLAHGLLAAAILLLLLNPATSSSIVLWITGAETELAGDKNKPPTVTPIYDKGGNQQ